MLKSLFTFLVFSHSLKSSQTVVIVEYDNRWPNMHKIFTWNSQKNIHFTIENGTAIKRNCSNYIVNGTLMWITFNSLFDKESLFDSVWFGFAVQLKVQTPFLVAVSALYVLRIATFHLSEKRNEHRCKSESCYFLTFANMCLSL